MTDFEYMKVINGIKNANMTAEERKLIEETVDSATGLTEEQYNGIKEALDNASENEVPYAIVKDDVVAVVGDANKTQLKKFEYEVTFEKPQYDEDENLMPEPNVEKKTYSNIFVKPRQNTQVVKWLAAMLPYFYKVNEKGEMVQFTRLEMLSVFGSIDGAILDTMYELVASILDIPNEDKDYMTGSSVLATVTKFIEDNPQTVEEAKAFFS